MGLHDPGYRDWYKVVDPLGTAVPTVPVTNTHFTYYPTTRLTDADVSRIAERVIDLLTERFDLKPMRAEDV